MSPCHLVTRDGFSSEAVVNRRVSRHVESLLPSVVSSDEDYGFEGQRVLGAERTPGAADSCLCHVETYVGRDGQFEVHERRRFDHGTDAEWGCTNRVARTSSGRTLDPFEYAVRTELDLSGRTRTDRSLVEWEQLAADPVYGGVEAQAATLLAEKMAHRSACERDRGRDHCGSLRSLGSLSSVVDRGRVLPVDWSDVDDLLGPDAETIAAAAGFERLEPDQRRTAARQKGVDFLSDALTEEMAPFEGSLETEGGPGCGDGIEPWQSLPPDVDPREAEHELHEMRRELRAIREELRPE